MLSLKVKPAEGAIPNRHRLILILILAKRQVGAGKVSALAPALAAERRAPSIAAVEWAYAIFQIKRDLAGLKWWQRWLFKRAWLPLMRFCVLRLGLPLVEKLDKIPCPHCRRTITIENGGCWTEKEGIVTTREMALAACKTSEWYHHKLTVNGAMTGETAQQRADHDFPLAGTKEYRRVSSDVEDVGRAQVESVHRQAVELRRSLSRSL